MSDSDFTTYSVLMSVYAADDPGDLMQSIDSILSQSFKTDDFVIVCDGPLTKELDEILNRAKRISSCVHIYRLDENRGLGEALAFGISKCKNELIARMDADDISLSDRCEKQLIEFRKKNVDVVGGLIVEFYDKPSNLKNVRVVPEHLDEIIKFSKFRSPVNHVSVMYKRSSVLAAGGYKDFPFLEDYYLWIRMLANGAIFYNMQQPLVLVRTGKSMYVRRSGFKLCRSQVRLAKYMKSIGYVSYGDFLKNVIVRVGGTLLPSLIRRSIYEQKLRDKANPCNYQ